MSQVVKIRRLSFRGVPVYLGEHQGKPLYSGNPERVGQWLCDGYRTRFNQHRSQRCKYVYADGERVLDIDGNPMLVPIGETVITVSDKQARQQFPHLAALPSLVLQAPARIESTEWFAAVKRRKTAGGSMPGFRSRKRGDKRFSCWFNGGRNAVFHRTGKRSGMLVISGQNPPAPQRKGRWEFRVHVRVSEPIREYTSVQVDLASSRVAFISPPRPVDRSRASGSVGIDRGVTHSAATSDGEFFDMPETEKLDKRIRFLQKRMAKSRVVAAREDREFWNSRRYRETRRQHAKTQRKRAACKNDAVHAFTKRIAENYEVVVLEALKTKSMTRKAKGKGAARKRALNRGILDARWGTLLRQVEYKTGSSLRGDEEEPWVFMVNPAYTSQRCSRCGHIAQESRESQAEFRCVVCGFECNADTNGAINVKARHYEGWANPPQSKGKTADTSVTAAPASKRKPPALTVLP